MIYWYFQPAGADAYATLLESLERSGLALCHAGSGRLTRLGPEGDQVDTTAEELAAGLAAAGSGGERLSFQLWLDPATHTDVVCSVRMAPSWSLSCFEASFDGLNVEEAAEVADRFWALRQSFRTLYWTADWLEADDRPDDAVRIPG